MHMRRKSRVVVAVLAMALAVGGLASTAGANGRGGYGGGGGGGGQTVLADGLVGPLHIDDAGGGNVLVSQSFAGIVSRIDRRGNVTDLVSEPGSFTGGVAAGPFGTVLFLSNGEAGNYLKIRFPNGTVRNLSGDLAAYEAQHNPDAGNSYGLQGVAQDCLDKLPDDIPELKPYTGLVDSNPYELAVSPLGVLVADAAGNDILFIDWFGHVRTVAVLPPRPSTISADAAAALGLDECVAGATMNFEPVPTDVELGRDWNLYVSSLPGGPEDPGLVPLLGARGGVFRVNPFTGRSNLIATGFAGATNLAVAPNGTVFVAELFGGQVSRVTRNGPVPVAQLNEPAALEWTPRGLLATADSQGSGKVVRLG